MVDTLPYTLNLHPTSTSCAPNEMDTNNSEEEPQLTEDIYALLCELASLPGTVPQNDINPSTSDSFLALPLCESEAGATFFNTTSGVNPRWSNARGSPQSDWSFARSGNLSPPPLYHSSSAPNISPADVNYSVFSWAMGETAVPTDVLGFTSLPNMASCQPASNPYAQYGAYSPAYSGTERKLLSKTLPNMGIPFMHRTYSDNSMPLIYCDTEHARDTKSAETRKDSLNYNINSPDSSHSAIEDDGPASDLYAQGATPSAEALAMGMVKRRRRTNAELKKCYECPWPDCNRTYASDHSRQQHIRIKHTRTHPSVLRRLRSSSPDRNTLTYRQPANHMLIPHPPLPGSYQPEGRRRAHSIGSLSEY